MAASAHSLPVTSLTQGLDIFVFNFCVHSFLILQVKLILKVMEFRTKWC